MIMKKLVMSGDNKELFEIEEKSLTEEELKKFSSVLDDYINKANASLGMKRYEIAVLLTKALEELGELYSKKTEESDDRAALSLRRDSVKQRIDTFRAMEEQLEGYSGAVRFVMKKYAEGGITDKHGNKAGRIYGPLSKLITVKPEHSTAIETALAVNIQNIVVDNEQTAKNAIYYLRDNDRYSLSLCKAFQYLLRVLKLFDGIQQFQKQNLPFHNAYL